MTISAFGHENLRYPTLWRFIHKPTTNANRAKTISLASKLLKSPSACPLTISSKIQSWIGLCDLTVFITVVHIEELSLTYRITVIAQTARSSFPFKISKYPLEQSQNKWKPQEMKTAYSTAYSYVTWQRWQVLKNANSSWHFCLFEWTFFYLSLICKLEFTFCWIDSTFWLQKPWIDSRYKKTWTRVQINIGKYRSYDADSCK